ncbi:MAG TPA: alanine racemase [Myxococcales bacterium LLY-WYZ-16_1]|nr:alanine racemase [Myxococcales bacterium LLY-WYZ-16_1]
MVVNDGETLRPTVAEIDVSALRHNVAQIRRHVHERPIMAIVKANAYGHGLVPTARILLGAGCDALGVAFLEEGIELRRAGVRAPILVLGGIIGNQIRSFIEHDLTMTASSVFKLRQIDQVARELAQPARVQLKVDTGMGRIGVQWDTSEELLQASLQATACRVEGLFSHLAASERADPTLTRIQTERFEAVAKRYRDLGGTGERHLANSGAVLQHPDTWYDRVRPGLMLYGVVPDPALRGVLDLRPALSLHSRVVFFKVVRRGRSVSYDATWVAPRDTRVVTVPVGYGDGVPRRLSNRAQVLIRGRTVPVVGRVTMDALMADLGPEGTAYNGDPVVLLGRQGPATVRVEDWAEWLETIPYEVLTQINTRVPRRYVRGTVLEPEDSGLQGPARPGMADKTASSCSSDSRSGS